MLVPSLCNTFDWMPLEPNYILFEFIINIGLVGALGWTVARHYAQGQARAGPQTPAVRAALFNSFAPFGRVSVVVLYFYAVLHKLNWDYFNVDISCSTFLLKGYAHRLPFLPLNSVSQWAAVWGTVIIEAAIPVLLCLRKTRLLGILLGIGFHSMLALHLAQGLYSFSGLLFALYLLFAPADFLELMHRSAQRLLGGALADVRLAGRRSTSTSGLFATEARKPCGW